MGIEKLVCHHRRQVDRRAWGSLPEFLDFLQEKNELKRIEQTVSPELEITALCHRALICDGPALQFDQPDGSSMPVVGNLFGSRRRILQALELEDEGGLRELGSLLAFLRNPSLPSAGQGAMDVLTDFAPTLYTKVVEKLSAPWQAHVVAGEDVDLSTLPISTCWPGDAGPLITWGMVITRSPRSGRINLAIYRQQWIGRNKLIMRWLAHRGGAQDFHDFQQAHPGEPFPVAVVIGADPATLLAAVTPIPDTLSEYQFAGILRGRRSRVTPAPLTGLPVPHGAEIVLEGHVRPGEMAIEGPFADHTGYYNAQAEFPVFTVERMSHVENPVYLTTYLGKPGEDEPSAMAAALNEVFIPLLQQQFPEVVDFYLPPEACSYRVAIVSIRKAYLGHARRIMFGIWSWLRQFTYTKTIIVVDDDIDARDWKEVIWAVSTRADPVRDTVLVDRTPIDYLDFASPEAGLGGKMGIDATHKWPGETTRAWGQPVTLDETTRRRIDDLAAKLGL
jgi:4-hydroxy-3-polyprenylbenzoate decarboxylase